MLHPFWLELSIIVFEQCEAATSKMEGDQTDKTNDAYNSRNASQTTKDNESGKNIDRASNNHTRQ